MTIPRRPVNLKERLRAPLGSVALLILGTHPKRLVHQQFSRWPIFLRSCGSPWNPVEEPAFQAGPDAVGRVCCWPCEQHADGGAQHRARTESFGGRLHRDGTQIQHIGNTATPGIGTMLSGRPQDGPATAGGRPAGRGIDDVPSLPHRDHLRGPLDVPWKFGLELPADLGQRQQRAALATIGTMP